MHPYLVPAILTGVGALIIILSSVLGFVVVPNLIDSKIEDEVRLIEGGETWDKWKEIPIPVYLNFYMLNVTNPDEFEAGTAIPVFVEKGPYSYRQTRVKVNISQEDGDQTTVSFEEVKTYFFDETTSCPDCAETDEFSIINLPFVAVVTGVAQQFGPIAAAAIANTVLASEKVIRRNVAVGELTFAGFNVSLYTDALGDLLPEEFEGGKFALYKTTNVSSDGVYKIYTGVGDSKDFGKIISWNGNDAVPDEWWRVGSPCAMINGTDGSIFPPFVEKSRRLDIFVTDLCRSLYLLYDSEVEHLGIKGYRFTAPKAMLEDPRINGDNMCFCMKDSVNDCPYGGVLSVSTCRGGAPISMSTPYFLDGDYKYNKESGLASPVREKHYTYIDLEIHTGVTLGASKKIQVNIDLRKFHAVNAMKKLKSDFMIMPLLWADEKASLDEDSANDLKKQLLTPLKIVNVAKWAVLAIGCLLVGLGIGFFIMRRRQSLETV